MEINLGQKHGLSIVMTQPGTKAQEVRVDQDWDSVLSHDWLVSDEGRERRTSADISRQNMTSSWSAFQLLHPVSSRRMERTEMSMVSKRDVNLAHCKSHTSNMPLRQKSFDRFFTPREKRGFDVCLKQGFWCKFVCCPSHRHRLTSTQMQSQQDVRRRGGKGFHIMCSQVIIVGFIVSSVIPLISLSPFPRTPLVITSLSLPSFTPLFLASALILVPGVRSRDRRCQNRLKCFHRMRVVLFSLPAIMRTASSPTDTGTMIRDDDGWQETTSRGKLCSSIWLPGSCFPPSIIVLSHRSWTEGFVKYTRGTTRVAIDRRTLFSPCVCLSVWQAVFFFLFVISLHKLLSLLHPN